MYSWRDALSERIVFWGRVDHKKVLQIVKQSNWAIILRDNNRVVQAGFPTKLVESISCGTPVLVNDFSNIRDYLDSNNSILIDNLNDIEQSLVRACCKEVTFERSIFDYNKYLPELEMLSFPGSI